MPPTRYNLDEWAVARYGEYLEQEYRRKRRRRLGLAAGCERVTESDRAAVLLEHLFGERAVHLVGGAAALAAELGIEDVTDLWGLDIPEAVRVANVIYKGQDKRPVTLDDIATDDDEFRDWLT